MEVLSNGVGISGVYCDKEELGFRIYWNTEFGFGHISFSQPTDGGLITVDSESVSKEFVKEILCALVDQSVFTS